MSELNINRKIFLEKEELVRFQKFLQESTANKVTLGNTTSWGILRTDFSGTENDFKIEAGTTSGTIKIANESFAVDNEEKLITQSAIDNITIPNDSIWRWVRISHSYRRHEIGTVSIDINGNMSGSGTIFPETLRGQSTDVPVNIKFLKSDLTPANNSGYYQIVDVTDSSNAILASNVGFQAESGLLYVVVGSTPIDEVISSEQAEGLYKYDDCLLELVVEEVTNTPPTTGFTQDKTFYTARVQNTGTELTIQDKRSEYWGFNIVGITDKLDRNQNLSDLTDKNAARNNLGVYSKSESDNRYLDKTENLNDLTNYSDARANLGVETPTELNSRYLQINNDLSDLSNVAASQNNLNVADESRVAALEADIVWVNVEAPSADVTYSVDVSNAYVGLDTKGVVRFRGYVEITYISSPGLGWSVFKIPTAYRPGRTILTNLFFDSGIIGGEAVESGYRESGPSIYEFVTISQSSSKTLYLDTLSYVIH